MFFVFGIIAGIFLPLIVDRIVFIHAAPTHHLHPNAFLLPSPIVYTLEHSRVPVYTFVHPRTASTTLLYFYGRGGSVVNSYHYIVRLYVNLNVTIIAPDYVESVTSVRNGLDELKSWLGNTKYIAIGSSLGSAMALYTNQGVVIIDNPFVSLSAMLRISWLVTTIPHDWNNYEMIENVTRCLVFTSENDWLVPSSQSKRLAIHGNCEHVVLNGCTHGDAPYHPKYIPAIQEFLKKTNGR